MGFIADIFTGNKAVKAQERAADKQIAASQDATDKNIALQKQMFDQLWGGTQVQRDAGDAATRQMAALMGLNLPASQATPQSFAAPAQAYPTGQSGAAAYYGGGRSPTTESMDAKLYEGFDGGNALAQYGQPAVVPGTQSAPASVNALAAGQTPTDWLRSTPGYQFNYDEGARALNTKLAGQGRLQSGDAAREAVRYGQNYGDRIYGEQFNRLAGIAGTGQVAQSQSQQAGQNYANQSGNALQWNANNMSSSYQNKADAQSGFWGQMGGLFGSNALAGMAGSFMKGGF